MGVKSGKADVRNNGAGDFGDKGFTCGKEAGSGTGNLPGCTSAQCIAAACVQVQGAAGARGHLIVLLVYISIMCLDCQLWREV